MSEWDEDEDIEEIEDAEDNEPTGLENVDVLSLITDQSRLEQLKVLQRGDDLPAEHALVDEAMQLHLIEEEIAARKLELKELGRRRDAIKLKSLVDGMKNGKLVVGSRGSFTYPRGRAHFEKKIYPSVPAADRAAFVKYARENDLGFLIIDAIDGRALRTEVEERIENKQEDLPFVSIFEKEQIKLVKARAKKAK